MKLVTSLVLLREAFAAWGDPVARRTLRKVLTNSACPNHHFSFPMRFDATYLYTIIPAGQADFKVNAVEQMIASAVSSSLDICDDDGRPTRVVELSNDSKHEVIDYEYIGDLCLRNVWTPCILLRGTTSILTANSTDSATIERETIDLINSTFDDVRFMAQESNYSDVSLALMLGVNLVLPAIRSVVLDTDSEHSGNQTLLTAVIAAAASITFTAVLLYLFFLKGEFGADGRRQNNKMIYLQAKRKRFFQDLDDESSLPMGWMVTNGTTSPPSSLPKEGNVTWSVSDLTSDAESIKSNLPLERIIEVEDEMSSEEGAAFRDRSYAASSPIYSPRSPVKVSGLEFIAHWEEKAESPKPTTESIEIFDYKGRKTVVWKQGDEEVSNEIGQNTKEDKVATANQELESLNDQEMGTIPSQSDDDTKFHTPTAIETADRDNAESDFGSPAAFSEDGESPERKTPTGRSPDRDESVTAGLQSPLFLWAQAAVQKIVGDM